MRSGRPRRGALVALSAVVLAGCGGPYSWLVEGSRAYSQGDLQAAKEAYSRVLDDPETRSVAHLNLGRVLLDQRDFAGAKSHLDEGLQGYPGWALGYLHRAEAETGLGLEPAAEKDLRKAVVLDPGLGSAWLQLARIELARGRFQQALDASTRAKADASLDEQATLLAVSIHRQLGNEAQAISELEALVSARPASASAFFEVGDLLLRQKEYERAESRLTQGLALEPDNRKGRLALARTFQGRERWDLAAPQYQAVVDSAASTGDSLSLEARKALAERPSEKKF